MKIILGGMLFNSRQMSYLSLTISNIKITAMFTLLFFLFIPIIASAVTQTTPTADKSSSPKGSSREPNTNSNPGAFIYDYNFEVPSGRGGMTPDLNLTYSSRSSEDQGFGHGWVLSLPYIMRQNKTGFDSMYSTTTPSKDFISSMSGELVNSTSTIYIARDDDGSNLIYVFSNNSWTVSDKSGQIFLFGTATSSRQDDINGSGRVFKWMLQKVTDANGNSITYNYTKNAGQIYPSSITYTDRSSGVGPFRVEFILQSRATTTSTSSASGLPVKTNFSINQVSIFVNNAQTYTYNLEYNYGDNQGRTVLKDVTESGILASTSLSLPATSFSYSTATKEFYTNGGSAPFFIPYYYKNGLDEGVNFNDVNGDGLTDGIRSHEIRNFSSGTTTTTKIVSLNLFNDYWAATSTVYLPPCLLAYTIINHPTWRLQQDGGGRMLDFNSDGLSDYICGTTGFLNTGNGWATSSIWTSPVAMSTTDSAGNNIDAGVRFADINGDGLLDILKGLSQSGVYTNSVFLNTGQGWATSTAWTMPFHLDFITNLGNDGGGRVLDINGDGLADFYHGLDDVGNATTSTYINNGKGWALDQVWKLPDNLQAQWPGLLFLDLNSDGLVDVSVATATVPNINNLNTITWTDNRVYKNTGSGWKRDFNQTIPVPYLINNFETSPRGGNFRGLGMFEVNIRTTIGSTPYYRQFSQVGNIPDLLKEVNETGGKKITAEYKMTSNLIDFEIATTTVIANPKLAQYFPVVETIEYHDGVGFIHTEKFYYQGGSLHYSSSTDKRFAGFERIIKSTSDGDKVMSYFHTGTSSSASTTGKYDDKRSKIGKAFRTEIWENYGDNLFKVIINKWDSVTRGKGNYVWPVRTTTLDYDGLSTHKDTSEELVYSTTTGNITKITSYGEVNAINNGNFTDVGSDKLITNFTYAASSTSPISKVSKMTVLDNSSAVVKETRYFYDLLATGLLRNGNLTEQNDLKSGTNTFIKTVRNTYNSLGLVTHEVNPLGATTTYVYDTLNLYPATTTNALGHSLVASYNYMLGVPYLTMDPNGSIIKNIYDPLNRVTTILGSTPFTPSDLATSTTFTYNDSIFPRQVKQRNFRSDTQYHDKYYYMDAFGRLIQTRTQTEDSSTYRVNHQQYYLKGTLFKSYLPFTQVGEAYNGPGFSNASLARTYLYDPLDRIVSLEDAYGETITEYANWKTKITDTLGNSKDYFRDAFGNLTSIVERNNSTIGTTTYAYDKNKNLTSIADALGNVRNFTYDKLSRIITAQDLHSASDTTFGSTTYTYDDAGNLTQRRNALSGITAYTYDKLNRVLIENSSSTPYVDIQYEYDYLNGCVCGASIGRLTEVSTGFNGTSYYYDWTGRLYYEDHNIPGMSINSITSYQYDRQGNPTYVVYPDNSFLWHSYHNSGDLQQLYLYENDDSGWQTVIQNINYGPSGKSEYVTYANSVTSNINYDQDYNYRLKSILTYSPSNYYQDLDYQYDDVGNILRLDDFAITPAARSVLYTYDDLYRLLSASTTAVASGQNYKETFTYNTIGNILTDSGTNYSYLGSSGSNYANPHAATQIGSNVNTYDTAGRLLTNGFLKNTWNYRDQLMQVVATKGTTTSTSTYTYNHEGSRITSTVGATTTFYLNKYYTVNSQGVKNKYIYAGDKLVAVVENGGGVASSTSYHHSDHLGSTGVVTNESGDLIQTVDYYPFGNERLNVASSTYRAQKQYIGEYYEKSNELSYLNARYYDASGSRFLSQDPVFWSNKQNLMDPQTLNSYSYASNNPINNMDPTGLATVKGSLEETQKALIKVLKSYISLLESVKSNPGGAAKSLARSAGSTAKNVVLNPGGMAYNAAASTRNSINTFRNGSDAVQDQMIGNGVAGLAGLLLPKGVKRIPDDALVVRGGGRSNQSANSINQAIAKSEAQGGVGFSANCSGVCTSISQINLLDKRPNPTLSVVTAGDVRAMGGDVIPTYGGTHVSVINISGNAASTLPWVEVDNPYY